MRYKVKLIRPKATQADERNYLMLTNTLEQLNSWIKSHLERIPENEWPDIVIVVNEMIETSLRQIQAKEFMDAKN